MRTFGRMLCAIAALVLLLGTWRLGRLQRLGPPHFDTTLNGGVPATIYIPGQPGSIAYSPFPLPAHSRWPTVILLHGYSADRASVSVVARRLAQNGFAVISIDFDGHGTNRNPFSPGLTDETLVKDTRAAVDYARRLPLLDGSRIIVIGHSMGAGTALDYAQNDQTIAGAVMISGGFDLYGPGRPRNTLFLYAQHDPDFIRKLAWSIAARLAGTEQLELNKVYGDIKAGTGVEAVEVAGANHFTILFSPVAASEVLNWCNRILGVTPRAALNLDDPRAQTQLIVFAAFIVLLVPLGFGLGAIAPPCPWPPSPEAGAWFGLLGIIVALVVALPLVSIYVPAYFLALDSGDVLISWLSIAGVGIIGALALTDGLRWVGLRDDFGVTVLTALLGFAVIYAMQVPRDVTLHNLSFTPERFLVFIYATLLLVPFFLGFEILVRRGRPWISAVLGAIGRAIIILVLILGLVSGMLPPIVSILVPLLVIYLVEAEIISAVIYARSGNFTASALIESAWLAWLIAATMPITVKI
jgi:dienelactone hydrolase